MTDTTPPTVQPPTGPARDAKTRRIAVVVNRRSGSADIDLDALVERMRGDGAEIVSVAAAEDPSGLDGLLRDAADAADTIALGGGDGTISAALDLFRETGRTLGILPLGTANDLARSLGIPLDPLEAADIVRTGTPRRIDLGDINGRLFCNAVSLGFPVALARHQDSDRKKWLGLLAYPLLWLEADREYEPLRLTLRHDGTETTLDNVFTLTVMNGRYHGGGLSVDDVSQIDDGMLKIYCLRELGKWRLLRALVSLKRGRLFRESGTLLVRAGEVRIASGRTLSINVDGDVSAETPAGITVLPGAIEAIAPDR